MLVFSLFLPFSLFLSAQLTNLTEIHDQISGMARCPYNPLHNSTALITSSGELYAATAMDFSGRDPAIYRSLGGLPPLRTAQYNSKWLNGKALEILFYKGTDFTQPSLNFWHFVMI